MDFSSGTTRHINWEGSQSELGKHGAHGTEGGVDRQDFDGGFQALDSLSLSPLCVSGLSGGFEVGRSFFDFLFSPSRKALSQPVQTLRGSGETGCDWRVNIVECTVQCDRCMDGTRALLGEY